MALPIKANDTQEGCNPISSNCVIWQGPDIPCITLCRGDTISDVTAKLAERLCTILDYLEVSAYDLTCFNPICTTPRDFQELIQILIERICAINNIPVAPDGSVGCPDCVVPVAQCLQRPDALGNITATLQLRDYVILIGNEICTIAASISSIDSRVTSLEVAVTDIQNNCCTGGTGGDLTMPISVCIGTADGTPVIDYLVLLDRAFCGLQTATGTQNNINTTLSYKCISGTDSTPSGTPVSWNQVPGWIDSPVNLAQSVQDLWLIVCNQNQAIINLQTQLNECCEGSGPPAPSCTEIVWNMTRGTMVKGTLWGILPVFTGSIPAGWTYPSSITGATVVITDNGGNTYTNTYDVLNWINNPTAISSTGFVLGVGPSGVAYSSTHFNVTITLTLVNGSSICTTTSNFLVTNTFWCSDVLQSSCFVQDYGSIKAPRIQIGLGGPLQSGGINTIPTTYTITLVPSIIGAGCPTGTTPTLIGQYVGFEGNFGFVGLPQTTWVYGQPSPATQSWTDPGLLNNCIDSATGTVVIQQGNNPSITCNITLPLVV